MSSLNHSGLQSPALHHKQQQEEGRIGGIGVVENEQAFNGKRERGNGRKDGGQDLVYQPVARFCPSSA